MVITPINYNYIYHKATHKATERYLGGPILYLFVVPKIQRSPAIAASLDQSVDAVPGLLVVGHQKRGCQIPKVIASQPCLVRPFIRFPDDLLASRISVLYIRK